MKSDKVIYIVDFDGDEHEFRTFYEAYLAIFDEYPDPLNNNGCMTRDKILSDINKIKKFTVSTIYKEVKDE